MNLADKTLSYVYLTALAKCTRDGKINDNNAFDGQLLISPQSIDQGLWFRNEQWNNTSADGPSVVRASYLAPGVNLDNGEVTCNTVVKEATQLWGFENPKALFCSFVKERANGSSCETGNGDFGKDEFIGHHNDLMSAITRLVYGGTTPSLYMQGYGSGYPGRYLIYEAAFLKGCSAKVASNPSADFRYRVKTVSDTGEVSERTYEGVKRDTTRYAYVDRDNLNDIGLTCAQIADRVNTYSTDYGLYRKSNTQEPAAPTSGDDATGANGNSVSSCAIDGIGWIVCPTVNFLAGLADGSFKILSDSLLRIDVQLVDTSSGTYTAWTVIRNVANVVFVIIFLIIIFSQLTSYGVSNYGVKKMLPRLIIAAILVNASFFICQLAVDISNILGYSIKDALGGVGNSIVEQSKSLDGVSPFASGEGFAGIAGGVIALAGATVIIYAMLSVLIPVLLAVVIALVMILFILIARQALVVILIVLAPLAFVAFLLPNTENLFKAWKKMFIAMLLLFPIIALVFGLSSVASDILAVTFSGDLGDTEANNWFGQIIAAAVLVLPLFVVPTLLKKSLDGIPVLGQMANKWQTKANQNLNSKLGEGYRNSAWGRGRAIRKQARQNYRDRKFANSVVEGGAKGSIARFAAGTIGKTGAQKYTQQALERSATSVADKARSEDISASAAFMLEKHSDPATQIGEVSKELRSAIAKGDVIKARAAQSILLNSGGKGLDTLHDTLSDAMATPEIRNSDVGISLRNALNSAGLKGKNNALATWAYTKDGKDANGNTIDTSIRAVEKDAGTYSGLSSTELGGQRLGVLKSAYAANPASISAAQASAVLNSPEVIKDMDLEKRAFFESIAATGQSQGVPNQTAGQPTAPTTGSTAAQRAQQTAQQAAQGTSGTAPIAVDSQGVININRGNTTGSGSSTPPPNQPPTP